MKNRCIIVMGVSGSGKSVIGKLLAEKLGYTFIEGDELHPKSNVDKMHSGLALTDADRLPWLDRIIGEARKILDKRSCIVACSALKKAYRDRLRSIGPVGFIFLDGGFELMLSRMLQREGHFMPESLLQSQFDTLEPPAENEQDVLIINNAPAPEKVMENAIDALQGGNIL